MTNHVVMPAVCALSIIEAAESSPALAAEDVYPAHEHSTLGYA
jgi:hypothetical protein